MVNSRKPLTPAPGLESNANSKDTRLEQAMELYLSQLESGTTPDRTALLQQFADVADELEGQLKTLDFLHVATPEVVDDSIDTSATDSEHPTTLGDFRLLRQIGRGGMGIVYEAIQISLDRRVAVKVLPFAAVFDENQRKRFKNEARAAATLDHPHIVPIYFVGQERGVHFYAMQLIEGQSLQEVIADWKKWEGEAEPAQAATEPSAALQVSLNPTNQVTGPATEPAQTDARARSLAASFSTQRDRTTDRFFYSIAELGRQVALALQHAHEQGIVHRDIKPGNLLLDENGRVWITDFGLARFEAHDSMTGQGDVLGTAAYMSPEQVTGGSLVDARSDIYSLAVTLYELLTLEKELDSRQSPQAGSSSHANSGQRWSRQVPRDLKTIVGKALEESPVDRYQTAQAFADDLQRFSSGRSIHARRPSWSDRSLKWIGRHRRMAMTLGVASVLLCVSLLLSTIYVWEARQEAGVALSQSRQYAARIQNLLYLADMQLAYRAWNDEQPERVASILERYSNEDSSVLPGIEWHALRSLAKQAEPFVIGKHHGPANGLAVFPDGRRVASVGDDKKLRVWDLANQQQVLVIDMGDSSVEPLFSVAISPDGQTIATGSDCVQLWNAATGERRKLLTSYDYNVQSIAFSPDGQRIATAARYDQIRLFSAEGSLLATVDGRARHRSLEFTPDSERLVVPSRESDLEGKPLRFLQVWHSDLSSTAFDLVNDRDRTRKCEMGTCSPDGRFIAASESSTFGSAVRLIHAKTGRTLLELEQRQAEVRSLAISPDSEMLIVGFLDGRITVFEDLGAAMRANRSVGVQKRTLRAHDGELTAVRFTGNRSFVSCGRDGQVKWWQLPAVEDSMPSRSGIVGRMAISPDRESMGAHIDGRFTVWEPGGRVLIDTPATFGGGLRYSPDGRFVATASQNGSRVTLDVWNAKDGATVLSLERRKPIREFDFSPTEERIACLDGQGRLEVLSTQTWQAVKQRSLFDGFDYRDYRCTYSRDGDSLICAGRDELLVIDAETLDCTARVPITSPVHRCVFDSDGVLLASAHTDGVIRLWTWPDMALYGVLAGHEGAVNDVQFSTDGRLLSVGTDGTTRIWSAQHLLEYGVLDRRNYAAMSLCMTPDDEYIYIGFNATDTGVPALRRIRMGGPIKKFSDVESQATKLTW